MGDRVTVNGVTLNVRDRGEGRPIVFIHGVMCSGRFFDRQLEFFSRGFRVVVPDLRGHGDSERAQTGHTVSNYARDLRALFEAIGVERPVLVGWSMGAMVAYEYLKEFGQDDVAGLVIVDQPPSDFAWSDGYPFGLFTLEALGETVEHIQMDLPSLAEGFAGLMLHEPSPEMTALLVAEITKVPPVIGTSILVNQTFQDYRPFLPEIKIPTLVLFGGDDKATSPEAGKWMAGVLPDSRLQIFDRSSHCPFLEEPDAFNAALLTFLEELSG
ncbi:MAG: alpha/beta fold hydrolase [Actinomycetota bacterium]